MELYQEIDRRRAARFERRMRRIERERVMEPIRQAFEVVAWAVLLYAFMFLGCL